MQSIGRCHVNAALQQQADEARVLFRIHIAAVIAAIVNGIAVGEIDLKHGTEALDDSSYFSPPEDVAKARDGGVANRM